MLRFKPEVRIAVFTDALDIMLVVAAEWSLLHKLDVVINSITDDAPGRVANSLHQFDLAIDCEPFGNLASDRKSLADYFRVELPDGFDVVFESSHVHVECDAHRPALTEVPG
jgi:hypothetical protein